MSSKPNSNKRTRSTNSATMKQATLGFPTFKRSASNTSAGSKASRVKATPLRTTSAPAAAVVVDKAAHEHDANLIDISSEDEDSFVVNKRMRVSAAKSKSTQEKMVPVVDIDLRAENPGKWNSAYAEARERNRNLKTIHTESENKVNAILRSFDMQVLSSGNISTRLISVRGLGHTSSDPASASPVSTAGNVPRLTVFTLLQSIQQYYRMLIQTKLNFPVIRAKLTVSRGKPIQSTPGQSTLPGAAPKDSRDFLHPQADDLGDDSDVDSCYEGEIFTSSRDIFNHGEEPTDGEAR
ncbi:hypothetical protein HWV62_27419 [Athelia sp. TMB]|nr:hypothetical protein HWV62_27419 [Athelia sp. TMB]